MRVVYVAPKGDAETVEMGGFMFHDGVEREIPDDAKIAAKLDGNWHFIVEYDDGADAVEGKATTKRPRGRPPNAAK
jgi:hypothetical protein